MKQERLIWFAIVFSTFIYAGMIWTLGQRDTGTPFAERFDHIYVQVLYTIAAITFALSAFVMSKMYTRVPRVQMIVRLALFEAVVIYGLVAAFLLGDWRLFVPTWLLGLLGMVMVYPRESSEPMTPRL